MAPQISLFCFGIVFAFLVPVDVVYGQCQCPCSSTPTTARASTAPPTIPATTPAPTSPPVTTGDLCTPPSSPFSWANANSWPLNNATNAEPTGLGDAQLDTQGTAGSAAAQYTVRKHNCLRTYPAAKNMLKMEWNSEAAAQAQTWANNCQFAHNSISQRTTSQFGCGQNIAMSTGQRLSWNKVINMWYNEVNDYVYGSTSSNGKVVGHYTQIVWAKTFQLGCAYRNCGSMFFYVCNYCPAGNMGGALPYAQGPSCADCTASCANNKLCTNSCPFSNVYSNCNSLQQSNNICAQPTSDLAKKCPATCNCQGKIY